MKKVLTASTNPDVIETVRNVCKIYPDFFTAEIYSETEEIIRFIDYELPEIKVLDFSSQEIDCEKILEVINKDAWLHYGGVIAICKNRQQVEELEERKDMNMLSIQTLQNFLQHFSRIIRILYQNQQFLFNRGMRDIIGGQEAGQFVCGNDGMDLRFYANFLISYLYNTNRISADDRVSLQLTFSELLNNALEHGNLEITYQDKTAWLMNGGDMVELIETRAKDPKYRNRKIHVSYILGKTASKFAIRDDGNGFDWKSAAKLSGEDEFHGRGIAMSKELVHSMTYNDKGNEVTFVIANQRNKSNDIPEIIQPFATIEYTNQEIVCREGEMSNDLYFIFSGRFAIYCKGKLTTVLTPNDLFIGEMAFLLNDRRTATVVSVGNSRLIKVPKADFMMLIRKNPHYGIFLSKMLAQRLVRQTKETLEAKKKLEEK